MKWLMDFLSDGTNLSMMRLMSLTSLVMGCGIAIYGISHGKDLGGIAQICSVFVGSAFAGKSIQKYMERE